MTQNPNIYRINKKHRLLKNIARSEVIIETIIRTSFKKLGFKTNYKSENLSQIAEDEIIYFLYLFNSPEIISDWKDFLPSNLTNENDFTQHKLSLILFIQADDELFCIIGGSSYRIIVPFIDHSFGLNTYARIMKPEIDELASIKSRGITGARAAMSEQFRDNYRIIDFIKFGKIPQEIHLKLSQEITDLHFKFLKKKTNERVQISVGKAFKIRKGVDFTELHKIILELGIILQLAPSDYLSSYKEINETKFIDDNLNPELITRIFNDADNIRKKDSSKRFEHDFCNPNSIEKFYEADEYKLKEKTEKDGYSIFKTVADRREIYESVINRAIERVGLNDEFKFKVFLQGVRITCYQNHKKTIGSNFLFHISTEFPINGKPIFLIDTKWYGLRDSFVEDLKINTSHILKTYSAPTNILDLNWNKTTIKTEKEYNLLYNNKKGYIVIDTIIADGLELCDILYYDDSNLYLIHVKYGFSSKIRELTNQINISAKRLKETLGTKDKLILEKIYKSLVDKNHDIDNLSLQEFKSLFNKRISYVLAFTSHLREDLKVVDNVESFDSNIARFSLIQCSSEMRAYYFDMLTYQIPREYDEI